MKKLGLLLCLVLTACTVLGGCGNDKPNKPAAVDVTGITVSASGLAGTGSLADPYKLKIASSGGALPFTYSVAPDNATDKSVKISYVTVVEGTVNEASSSPYITLSNVTASSFAVAPKGIGTAYLQLKSNDGKAKALVEITVKLRDMVVSAETAAYAPEDYYYRDQEGEIAVNPDTGDFFMTVPALNPFTGEPIMNGSVPKQEQIRNIYRDYVNGFATVSESDRENAQSEFYNADYNFVGIQDTTLNATFGELVHNKENFNNVSMLSSGNNKDDLDQVNRVRYYKNMLYNTFEVEEAVADKTLHFKYYSDGALTGEITAADSPVVFTAKENGAATAKKSVSFTAPKSGSVWVKVYCGSDDTDFCVIKAKILPAYGAGVQKTDFDAKTASAKLEWDFIGNEGNKEELLPLLGEWNAAILQSSNKFQVKTYYYGASETVGNTDGFKGLQFSNRFEVFTNMGLTGNEVLVEENAADPLKNKYTLPFDFDLSMGGFWNKVTLPASGVSTVTAKVKASHDKTTVGDFRIRLFTADGASFVGEWSDGAAKGSEIYDISADIPAAMLGKTVGVVIECRVPAPVYNQDAQMIVLGVKIA